MRFEHEEGILFVNARYDEAHPCSATRRNAGCHGSIDNDSAHSLCG
jgi:hypothetical protein